MSLATQFPLVSCCLTLLLVGCNSRSDLPEFYHDLVPVTGTVTMQGQPLSGATVTFYAVGDNAVRSAYGLTNDQGQFTLATPIRGLSKEESQGAIPGTYRVLISKYLMPDGNPLPEGVTHADAEMQGAKESISRKYNDEMHSKLSAEVQADPSKNEFQFEL